MIGMYNLYDCVVSVPEELDTVIPTSCIWKHGSNVPRRRLFDKVDDTTSKNTPKKYMRNIIYPALSFYKSYKTIGRRWASQWPLRLLKPQESAELTNIYTFLKLGILSFDNIIIVYSMSNCNNVA